MKIHNEIIAQEKSHNSTYNLIDKQQLRQPSTYRGVKVRLLIFQIENLNGLFLVLPRILDSREIILRDGKVNGP